ncbi:proteasome accessory factor PafA2 family protein [Actinomyces howellii]|uniref:Pup deamidase/depupylase n=1 Tax=Actinomyces howellii TaxID=52771 RepID=A0A448HEH9_9ACTO|nr:proteasome accessory factor PafA2 family protein [Actinomyces howellii]VEG26316.1 Pup deamidase/depupylase [Actinomyces howellii]
MSPEGAGPGAPFLGPVSRPVGLETEYGVVQPGNVRANPVALATRVVEAYGAISRPGLGAPAVAWDYEAEDPLADLRGGRVDRSAAHPSQLTDDPTRPAPSGPDALDGSPAPQEPGTTGHPGGAPRAGDPGAGRPVWSSRSRPSALEARLPRATTAVLTNGARLYVDHAHPEYSSPEVLTPRDALVWDRAGEVVARQAMEAAATPGAPGARGTRGGPHPGERADDAAPGGIVLYKNNVDGKGATYGSHENYLVRRDLPFHVLATALIPFLVTRPVIAGAGRVGIGQRSERPGFQISQRADYVETEIGLQTTFNRPIVNTRDEPHAQPERFRRLHVINGDANRLDAPIYLKVATTDLVLWYLERAHDRGEAMAGLERLRLTRDPVEEHWRLSHDTSLRHALATAGGPMTALEIQRAHLEAVRQAVTEDFGGTGAQHAGPDTAEAIGLWEEALSRLESYAEALGGPQETQATSRAAEMIEWVAKLQLCQGLRERTGASWDDPRLAALDIQWADLRAGRSVVDRIVAAGLARRLCTDEEVAAAAVVPPRGTRAAARGRAVAEHPEVVGASWTSLVIDAAGRPDLLRLALPDEVVLDEAGVDHVLADLRRVLGPSRSGGGD